MALQREQVVQTAEKYVSRGKIEPAIREYRKLLAENPNDINTLNRVGDLYARIQRIEEAVDFFNQIGQQYADQGFFVKAIAIYKKIIKLDPTRLEVYERLADLYHRQNLVTEARTQYQVLADYYTKHDNAASAIAIYHKMVDLEPENPSYHVKLAEIYHQQKLFEKAVNEYRIIAEMMIRHGRSQEAAQVYERALAIDSKNLRFIRSALEALRDAGAEAAASHFLTVAIERNPEAQELVSVLEKREEPPAPEPEPEPEPEPMPAMAALPSMRETPTFENPELDDASIELEIDLGDDLMAAMREAEAAVSAASGSSGPAMKAAAPAVDDEVDLEFDLDPMEELEVELPEEAPASQVKPPPDLAGAPARPAWARSEPAAPAPSTPAEIDEVEFELDLEIEIEAEPSFGQPGERLAMPAMPEITAFDSGDAFILEDEIEVEAMPAWEVEETAAPAGPSREELERDELITEAEVLAKYGLEEKALERLGEALRVRPDSLTAHALLIRIHLDKNRHDKVLELARTMSGIATAARVAEPWAGVRQRLVESGYRLEGNEVLSGPFVPAPPLPAPAPPMPEPAPPIESVQIQEIEAIPPTPPLVAAAPAAPVIAPPPRPTRREVDDMMRGILGPQTPARKPAAPPAVSVPKAPPPAVVPAPAAAPAALSKPPAAPPAGGLFDLTSLGEMIEAEEMGDAPAMSLPSFPVSPPPAKSEADLLWDSTKPGLAPGPSLSVAPSAAPSVAPFGGGLEDSGVGWLDEADKSKAAASGGSALFDDEDDFFDLAGELVEELSREEVFQDGVMVQQEQSLEEIVEGFKKGVAEHLSPTDYDTHYNLGIAYREMGLLDEAIGEFQLAAKDERYLVICCSMLGLCFLDKGLPELAIKWYRRGLEATTLSEDDQLGLMYDMGNAFMAMGDSSTAYGTFVEIYGINTNYRDVVAKLEELRR